MNVLSAKKKKHFLKFLTQCNWKRTTRVTAMTTITAYLSDHLYEMSLVTRKPVFGVFDQVRLKPLCSAKEASLRLEILDIETAPLFFAYGKSTFCHDVAQIVQLGFNRKISIPNGTFTMENDCRQNYNLN